MKWMGDSKKGLVAMTLVVALAGLPVVVRAVVRQDDGQDESAKMMEAMMKAGTPDSHHAVLAKLEGDWKADSTFWMEPGAEPMKSTGTMKNEMIYDGRYLVSEFEGDMMGETFRGRGTWGYNVVAKQYEGTWIDSMSTMTSVSHGTCSDDGKTFTSVASGWDPMTGERSDMKEITKILGPDKYTMTFYQKGPDGKEYKSGEIVFTK